MAPPPRGEDTAHARPTVLVGLRRAPAGARTAVNIPLYIRLLPAAAFRAWFTPPPRTPRLEAAEGVERSEIETERGTITALDVGEGPVVLALHGWGGIADQMAPIGRRLAGDGYRVIAPDLPGRAGSEPTDLFEFVATVRALVQETGRPALRARRPFFRRPVVALARRPRRRKPAARGDGGAGAQCRRQPGDVLASPAAGAVDGSRPEATAAGMESGRVRAVGRAAPRATRRGGGAYRPRSSGQPNAVLHRGHTHRPSSPHPPRPGRRRRTQWHPGSSRDIGRGFGLLRSGRLEGGQG